MHTNVLLQMYLIYVNILHYAIYSIVQKFKTVRFLMLLKQACYAHHGSINLIKNNVNTLKFINLLIIVLF